MILQPLIDSAEAVGINMFISNSNERIETQLNSLTREGDLPIILVSWDVDVDLTFDQNGLLLNPAVQIVCLLVSKPEDLAKDSREETAQEMGALFTKFIQDLSKRLAGLQREAVHPVSNVSYKLVPKHGAGQHSGVLGRFQMKTPVENC